MKIYRSQLVGGVLCDVVLASDAEAMEKRVEELDAIIKKMRNCHNCKLFKPYHNVVECNTCGDEGEGLKFWELKDE